MVEEQKAEYRVLARKYRPQNFEELIGQDALVRTLKNAIESGRIAHAFMLTGVRGVGKTTTARIIAKALNYRGPDGTAEPTVGDTADCALAKAISEDRHPDVIEMDAASRTGIDDIREILDGVRYAPSEARYKVYIIDEVHMLSKQAFNALLKTLEEPPAHVKFIFATTEIRKVPITVLSRCQRFDLRRVDVPTLAKHFAGICEKENVQADDAALQLIARAADGSVRDGLSLLDQAIALGDATVSGEQVQDMLGLADRGQNLDLLEHVLSGRVAKALAVLDAQYNAGGDPLVIIQDLLDLTHLLTRFKSVPESAKGVNAALSPDMMERTVAMAGALSMPTLGKTWQLLLKGLTEVQYAPSPQAAAEMIVIRLAYAADLPDPRDLMKNIQGGGNVPIANNSQSISPSQTSSPVGASAASGAHSAPMASAVSAGMGVSPTGGSGERASLAIVPDTQPETEFVIQSLEDVAQVLEQDGEVVLASEVSHGVELVSIKPGVLEIGVRDSASARIRDLQKALSKASGQHWMVSIVPTTGAATLVEKAETARKIEFDNVLQMPVMQKVFEAFPDAKLVDITHTDDEPKKD